MVFAWVFILIAAMVYKRETNKLKRGKSRKELAGPSEGDFEAPDIDDTIDWEALANEDDEENKDDLKEKGRMTTDSVLKQYSRQRSSRGHGIHIGDPMVRESFPQTFPKGKRSTGSASRSMQATETESQTENDITKDGPTLSTLHHNQQRLSAEQERLAVDLRRVEKKCSKMSKLLKGIQNTLYCSSSTFSDSDD